MANFFSVIISGNLTADAAFKKISEETGVVNFTIAHNFPTSKKDSEGKTIFEAQFYDCVKWINTGEEPKALLEKLKKGYNVITEIQKIDISTSEKDGVKYKNTNFVVSKIG